MNARPNLARIDELGQRLADQAYRTLISLCPEIKTASSARQEAVCAAMRAKMAPSIDRLLEDARVAPCLAEAAFHNAVLTPGAGRRSSHSSREYNQKRLSFREIYLTNPYLYLLNIGGGTRMATKDFKYSVENFRGIAIFFVMLSHLSSFSSLGPAGKYLLFTFVDATTWFVFISGYLFSHIEKNINFKYIDYIYKKFKFVIIPYLILSIPAILVGLYFQRHTLLELNVAEYILWSLSVGGSVVGPMWFIPMADSSTKRNTV